jgi:hypothetical protein
MRTGAAHEQRAFAVPHERHGTPHLHDRTPVGRRWQFILSSGRMRDAVPTHRAPFAGGRARVQIVAPSSMSA